MATQVTLNSGSVDSAGSLALKTNGTTTAVTINASQGVEFNAGTAAAPSITTTGDTNTGIFFPAADTIAFTEGGVESMRIDSSGNVGIGTDSPAVSGLEISRATGSASPTPAELRISTTSNASDWSSTVPWGRLSFYSGDASSNGPKIHAAIDAVAFSSSAGASNLVFSVAGSGAIAEVMRLDASGNLLVGDTAAISDERLYVRATTATGFAFRLYNTQATAGSTFGQYILYSGSSPNGTGNQFLRCDDSTTKRAEIRSNGGIANYSANNVNLASDLRLKHDIEPVQSYWNVFKSIEWKTWLYNDQTDEIKNIGVIAQELQALAPELVCESNALPTPEGESPYLGLWENDFKMAGMSVITELVKRCEEQQAIITQLQADVAALKGTA